MIINYFTFFLLRGFLFPSNLDNQFNENFIDKNSVYNLIIFFNEDDCEVCLNEIKSFNKLNTKVDKKNLRVIGVLNSDSQEQRLKFCEQNNIEFEMRMDKEIFKKHNILSHQTPFFVLVDTRNKNRIIYQSYAKKDISSQMATYEIVNLIIRNQN